MRARRLVSPVPLPTVTVFFFAALRSCRSAETLPASSRFLIRKLCRSPSPRRMVIPGIAAPVAAVAAPVGARIGAPALTVATASLSRPRRRRSAISLSRVWALSP